METINAVKTFTGNNIKIIKIHFNLVYRLVHFSAIIKFKRNNNNLE